MLVMCVFSQSPHHSPSRVADAKRLVRRIWSFRSRPYAGTHFKCFFPVSLFSHPQTDLPLINTEALKGTDSQAHSTALSPILPSTHIATVPGAAFYVTDIIIDQSLATSAESAVMDFGLALSPPNAAR